MSKIICDICGTSYPDTAEQCPICGYSRELNGDNILSDAEPMDTVLDSFEEEPIAEPVISVAEPEAEDVETEFVVPVQPPVVSDEDEDEDDEDDDEDDEDDEEEEEGRRSNTGLVVLLVILIVALLGVIGFIAWRYFLPNLDIDLPFLNKETTSATTEATQSQDTVATTEPTIPCTGLALVSEGVVVLEEEGANWLINVAAEPADTTDKIIYASSDESVVTVDEDGKLTAVGQGTAVITITCGEKLLQCNVTCFFIEETTAPTATTAPEVFEDETTAPTEETTAPTEPEETTPATEETKPSTGGVTLTLNKTDISFSVVPAYYTLEILEEDINPEDVTWISTDGSVCIVHDGKLQIVGWGTCKIIAEYKGVQAECIIRVFQR